MISSPEFVRKVPVLKRWVPGLLKRYARRAKHRYTVERRLGYFFLLDQENSVDRNLLIKGVWEPDQIKTLTRLVRTHSATGRRSMFLDIGAHGGLYSILMYGESIFEEIVMFEAEPANAAQLRANLFLNDLVGKMQIVEKAASNQAGKIKFYSGPKSNRGTARMTNDADSGLSDAGEIEAVTIDQVVSPKDAFVVAKIDVEGSEITVLEGMGNVIERNKCLFQIESFPEKFPELDVWMTSRHFKKIETVGFDHFYLKDRSESTDETTPLRQLGLHV